MNLLKTRSARSTFNPSVEALEDRQLLSATVLQTGTLLKITGSSQADNIVVNDNGTQVRVFAEGVLKGTFSGVAKIQLNTKEGADRVTYNVLGTAPININTPSNVSVVRQMDARLGQGPDRFEMNVVDSLPAPGGFANTQYLGAQSDLDVYVKGAEGNDFASLRVGTIGFQSSLKFRFDGDNGSDGLNAFIGGPFDAQQANTNVKLSYFAGAGNDSAFVNVVGTLTSSATMDIDLHGQQDNDSMYMFYQNGIMNGQLNFQGDGGPGRDQIFAQFELRPFSNLGILTARINGGPDNDNVGNGLTLIVHKANPANTTVVDARIDGGPGLDLGRSTANVIKTNIETSVLLP